MRNLLLVICLIISNSVLSQSNKPLQHIKPKWKLGEHKKVHTETFTKVYLKDSLFNNTEAKSDYSIKVIDTVKYYTILYSNETGSLDIKSDSRASTVDSVMTSLTSIIKKVEKETKTFQYELLVDKNTGQALRIKNQDKLFDLVQELTSKMIDEIGEKAGKSHAQIDSAKQKLGNYFKSSGPKITETILNEFNYIMTAYSLRFPYNSSISQKAMVHDVNAMGDFGGIEMPAIITTSSKKGDKSLKVQTDTDYDKDFLLEQIKKKYKNMSHLTASDIILSEKTEALFSTTTNWIVSHKSSVVFITKEVRVVNETQVNFQ